MNIAQPSLSLQPPSLLRPAHLEGWLYVPVEAVGNDNAVAKLITQLTHVPRKFRPDDREPVALYDASRLDSDGYLGVPRAFGMRAFGSFLQIEDRTTLGLPVTTPKRPDPNHPRVRNPIQQRQFMDDLARGIRELKSFLATAPTGSGKTVCFLDAAAEVGRTTLIMVHLERLMDQWIEEIMDKLGVPRERIARIQQGSCNWVDKDFGVALMPSLVRREYPDEFYRHWGLVGFDEVHKVGTNHFAPAATQFPSAFRVGLSATMERKDGGDKVFIWNIGPISVRSEAEALPCRVYVRRYKSRKPLWGKDMMTRVKCLVSDRVRNRVIARNIAKAYEKGKQGLVVSASVEHLQALMDMCHDDYGVPYRAMGRFFGQIHLGTKVVTDQWGQKIKKKSKQKRTGKELALVKEKAQIIFATYGMMTEGIDIPRLDWGIDATPSGKATQLIGRVRRPFDGKTDAVWITMLDEGCAFSERMFKARCREYAASGAQIIDVGG